MGPYWQYGGGIVALVNAIISFKFVVYGGHQNSPAVFGFPYIPYSNWNVVYMGQ